MTNICEYRRRRRKMRAKRKADEREKKEKMRGKALEELKMENYTRK